MNEYFPYLFGNCGKITELGVSWVFFSPFFCLAFCLICYFYSLKKKDTKGKGPFTPFVRYQNKY